MQNRRNFIANTRGLLLIRRYYPLKCQYRTNTKPELVTIVLADVIHSNGAWPSAAIVWNTNKDMVLFEVFVTIGVSKQRFFYWTISFIITIDISKKKIHLVLFVNKVNTCVCHTIHCFLLKPIHTTHIQNITQHLCLPPSHVASLCVTEVWWCADRREKRYNANIFPLKQLRSNL